MSARHAETSRQSGIALITVLLIVAVLTTIVGKLSFGNQVWLRQAENAANGARTAQVSRAAQVWVRTILDADDPGFDARTEAWAQQLPPLPVGGGSLSGRIEDLQGRYNLNNLVGQGGQPNELEMERFERLLNVLDLNADLAHAIADWIDADSEPNGPWGAEDGYYLGLKPAYLAANRPLTSAAELRLVRGVDMRTWRRLEPYVTALPTATPVNVNTASAIVLAAAMTNWGAARSAVGRAERWVHQALSYPARNLEAFAKEAIGSDETDRLPPGLAVASRYFEADVQVEFERLRERLLTTYVRSGGPTRILSDRRRLN